MAVKTALLVIDMQRFFQSMTITTTPNIKKLVEHFRSTSSPIVFTRHGHSKDELSGKIVNQIVRRYGVSECIATGSDDWEFQDDVQALVDDVDADWPKVLVGKNTYDAFINTDLQQILHTAAVERVVVCGVMTDFCCDTTARSAFNRGFETWLISDACGSANETQHQAGLRGFGFAFGEVLTTKEAISRLESE